MGPGIGSQVHPALRRSHDHDHDKNDETEKKINKQEPWTIDRVKELVKSQGGKVEWIKTAEEDKSKLDSIQSPRESIVPTIKASEDKSNSNITQKSQPSLEDSESPKSKVWLIFLSLLVIFVGAILLIKR